MVSKFANLILLGLILFGLGQPAHSGDFCSTLTFDFRPVPTEIQWLDSIKSLATQKILDHISPHDGLPGAVVASPTRTEEVDYYFHWVRDAALVANAMLETYQKMGEGSQKNLLEKKLFEYFEFSKYIQGLPTISGLGEPKVTVKGTTFNDPWGRPQMDGPALRAISFMNIVNYFKSKDSSKFAQNTPSDIRGIYYSHIKSDLDYVRDNWWKPSWDLWEEVYADHFFTRMVQRKSLLDGAEFAIQIGDHQSAEGYLYQARAIERSIKADFFDTNRNMIIPTKKGSLKDGISNKHSDIDIAVILGLLHGWRNDGFILFNDPIVVNTIFQLEEAFKKQYPINHVPNVPGLAIGRYPEDMFSGKGRTGGNPWILATLGMAEIYYRMAAELKIQPEEYKRLMAIGDGYVARVKFHSHSDGSQNEQFRRDNGFMTSVADLTWNYAADLTTLMAREAADKSK